MIDLHEKLAEERRRIDELKGSLFRRTKALRSIQNFALSQDHYTEELEQIVDMTIWGLKDD